MSGLTYNQIANNACDAIEILIHNALNNAKFDTTITGFIYSVINEASGEYKIKIQDAVYTVTAADPKMVFKPGDQVYILIPQNDFSKPKKIIGLVETTDITEEENQEETRLFYQTIGENVVTENSDVVENYFSYCTYDNDVLDLLYDVNPNKEFVNKIKIDETALFEYMQNAKYLRLSMDVKTLIPIAQRYTGDFGLVVEIDFKNKTDDNNNITRTFLFNSDSMLGAPHNLPVFTNQSLVQEIDGKDYLYIKRVYLYVKGFKEKHGEVTVKPNDVFFNNLSICALTDTTDIDWNGHQLILNTSKGATLTRESANTIIEAQLLFQGRKIDDSKIKYYWFLKNGSIDISHNNYCVYGGQGWYCLNEKQDDEQWKPLTNNYTINVDDIVTNNMIYKCVAVYQDQIYTQTISIFNQNPLYNLQLNTNNVMLNSGMVNLKCDVCMNSSNSISNDNFNFYWSKINNAQVYEILDSDNCGAKQIHSECSNKELYNILTSLRDYIKNALTNNLLSLTTVYTEDMFENIANSSFNGKMNIVHDVLSIDTSKKIYTIKNFQSILISYINTTPISFIADNVLYKLGLDTINKTTTVSCAVFNSDENGNDNKYIGTVSKEISNTVFNNTKKYALNLINNNQTFKYNSEGKSPTHSSNESPQEIKALSFMIFDENGKEINPDTVNQISIKWKIPMWNSMIEPVLKEDETLASLKTDELDEYYIIEDTTSLAFSIADIYNHSYENNNIELEVIYDDVYLRGSTNFTFLKDGETTSNNTNYYCKITTKNNIAGYPTLYSRYTTDNKFILTSNFANNLDTDVTENLLSYFNAEFWRANQRVTPDKIEWAILKEPYENTSTSPIQFISTFTSEKMDMVQDDAQGSFNTKIDLDALKKIIEENIYPELTLQATITYQDKKYYATLPLTWIHFMDVTDTLKHHVEIKPKTGFNEVVYTADAQNPQYNSALPFEIIVYKREANIVDTENENIFYEADITNLVEVNQEFGTPLQYNWGVYGHCADTDKNTPQDWLLTCEKVFITRNDNSTESVPNKIKILPPKTYDGFSVTNGMSCDILFNGNTKPNIKIFFPIHLYLNRYGLSQLNDWNGNSIKISEDEGYILTPQIGAGRKENDNTFTGMFMGEVKDSAGAKDKVGLMGYGHGIQTMFLDAETGSAYFGKGKEIAIEPDGNDTKVKLGSWNLNNEAIWKGSDKINSANGIYMGDEGFSLGQQLVFNENTDQLTVKGQILIEDAILDNLLTEEEAEDNPELPDTNEGGTEDDGTEVSDATINNSNSKIELGGSQTTPVDPDDIPYKDFKIQTYTDIKNQNEEIIGAKGIYISPNAIRFREENEAKGYKYTSGYIEYIPNISGYLDTDEQGNKQGGGHFYFSKPICATSFRVPSSGVRMISSSKQTEKSEESASLYSKGSKSLCIAFGPRRDDCLASNYSEYGRPRRTYLRGDRLILQAFGTQHVSTYRNRKKTYYGQIVLYGRQTRVYNYGKQPYTNKSWTTTSDERTKNLKPLNEKYYNFFEKLIPYAYTWKDEEDGAVNIGYSAQQVKQALFDSGLELKDFNGLIIDYDEEMDKKYGIKDFHTLSYEQFGPIYAAVLQRALDKIEQLEKRIEELEK